MIVQGGSVALLIRTCEVLGRVIEVNGAISSCQPSARCSESGHRASLSALPLCGRPSCAETGSPPVFQCIKCTLFLAAGFGWSNHFHTFVDRLLHDGITVVGFVGQQLLPRQTLNQPNQLGRIGLVASRQLEAQRIAQGISYRMNFGVQSAAREVATQIRANF